MLESYGGFAPVHHQNRATSLKPRRHREPRDVGRPSDFMGGGDDMFGDFKGMHNHAMKEFDNMHKNMFDFGFGSKY